MPDHPHIERYHAELTQLIEFGGSDSELNIRPAFQNCLAAYCGDRRERFALVPELRTLSGVVPDGTVKDSLRMARGYWEAKDTHDDLDAEIQRKLNRGYPRDNILFEDSETAVLIQNREEAMRVDMSRPDELHRLIRRFLDYELPQIEEFRQAQKQFKDDLPAVLANLRGAIEAAESDNSAYRAAAADFLRLCRQSISPEVSEADVREMLLQHILTRDIFLRVFGEDQFHRENNIARQLDALEQTFFTGDVRREAIDRLRLYYGAIGRAADEIADYAEKQGFLKAMYEDFYKAYNPAAADRLGVVYTPNEIVDFIIRVERTTCCGSTSDAVWPTGTCRYSTPRPAPARSSPTSSTTCLPTGWSTSTSTKYTPTRSPSCRTTSPTSTSSTPTRRRRGSTSSSPTLVLRRYARQHGLAADGATGGAVTRQGSFNLGGLSVENWIRIQEQNEKPISVIIGNPPYNANQQNENDIQSES